MAQWLEKLNSLYSLKEHSSHVQRYIEENAGSNPAPTTKLLLSPVHTSSERVTVSSGASL